MLYLSILLVGTVSVLSLFSTIYGADKTKQRLAEHGVNDCVINFFAVLDRKLIFWKH